MASYRTTSCDDNVVFPPSLGLAVVSTNPRTVLVQFSPVSARALEIQAPDEHWTEELEGRMGYAKLDAKQHFEVYADVWSQAAHFGAGGAYPLADERKRVILSLMGDVPAQARVLDLGCGPGILLSELAERDYESVGVDFAEAMIVLAAARVSERTNCTVVRSDINSYLDSCEPFDAIIAAGVIYYQDDVLETLTRVAAALTEAGIALISFRNGLFRRSADKFAEQVLALSRNLSPNDWAAWVTDFSLELNQLVGHDKGQSRLLESVEGTEEPSQTTRSEPKLDLASHTPEEIHELAGSAGLRVSEMRGVHPHLLHPALDDDAFVSCVDRLSTRLHGFDATNLDWFSHVVVKLERVQ